MRGMSYDSPEFILNRYSLNDHIAQVVRRKLCVKTVDGILTIEMTALIDQRGIERLKEGYLFTSAGSGHIKLEVNE
jgi:hypothetical protein